MTIIDELSRAVSGTVYENRVYIAGGWVRDQIRGVEESVDLDLVVDLPDGGVKFTEWLAAKMGGTTPIIYPRFGTGQTTVNGMPIESVAPRIEVYDQSSRKPVVQAGTLRDEVFRRDFCANSLLQRLDTGEILDLTGRGLTDIRDGIIDTPLDPVVTITDDALRALRAVRFATKFGWTIADRVLAAMKSEHHRLSIISIERVRDEFSKALLTPWPDVALDLLADTELLFEFLPELRPMIGCIQNRYHIDDVWTHTLKVVQQTPPSLVPRLGALFHDVGKPKTRSMNPKTNDWSFINHELVGAEMAANILKRLTFPNDVVESVSRCVELHMGIRDHEVKDATLRKWARRADNVLEDLLYLVHADCVSHHPDHCQSDKVPKIRERLEKMKEEKTVTKQKLISGDDLIHVYGLAPGKQFKDILDRVQVLVDENPAVPKIEAMSIIEIEFKLTKVTKVCPSCNGTAFVSMEQQAFPYGADPDTVQLTAAVPVWHCQSCSFDSTDHVAEDIRTATVKAHLAKVEREKAQQAKKEREKGKVAYGLQGNEGAPKQA